MSKQTVIHRFTGIQGMTLWQDSLGEWWVLDTWRGWGPFAEEEARQKMRDVE